MYVVLCRGDLNEAEIEVFGPFENEEKAEDWISTADGCANEHEAYRVRDYLK